MSKQTCDQSIGCDVTNCTYNENGTKCTAQHIVVENKRDTTQAETYCSTFKNKGSGLYD